MSGSEPELGNITQMMEDQTKHEMQNTISRDITPIMESQTGEILDTTVDVFFFFGECLSRVYITFYAH